MLTTVFIQDLRFRAVYWFLFPALLLSFIVLNIFAGGQNLLLGVKTSVINIGFLSVQLIVLNLYFSFKMGGWKNVAVGLLGWGDILFLYTAAFALPAISFSFFYIASLVFALLCWVVYNLICGGKNKNKNIPLAGLQALFLGVLLLINWWFIPLNILTDNWLIYYIGQ
ncbi:hypothetical protein [Mucilaginibacter sp. L3T2-6]|uniref:hypothetical protein n=1 Tax=Mucilaginibacter sp. L3T2-6 TaxID=3062491 RepID=UPI00267740CD|nr:hypothetical protein [Mucilaginibacter sp. L3T2-6]MDO3645231.1 hypothetical protein [Mucilaginibacter sp. L3T2-6]MDV6217683.1 hypothetical protein [Mucilaginibacter sp. L3T2-6]